VRLAAQISEALAAAHSQAVIHSDIKPENIMVLPGDRVKLLDFGVARHEVEETVTISQLPVHSPIAGTLAYMAPEKFAGSSGDARSDLFSFGVLLYEMAAGKRPFRGPNAMALAAQVMKEDPEPFPGEEGTASAVLSRITFKLLQKDPASRYQSAQEVQLELNTLSRHLEIEALLPAAVAGKTTVAVLPFKLLTPTPEDEYLRVALADPVINRLSASGDLLVRPMSAVMRYAGQNQTIDLKIVARELGVEILVDGSIQKIGRQLRVNVQAWNVTDGSSRLSAKFDSEASEIFQLQDRIAEGLARELNPTAPRPLAGSSPTKNPEAYELFLRAVERMHRINRWDMRIAIEMFENATAIDPHFADAWAGLAEACVMMSATFEPGLKWIARAEKAVRMALILDRNNVEAYVARGRLRWTPIKNFQHRPALLALQQALQRRPTHDRALSWQGLVLMHIGLQQKAKECLAMSLAVCPDNSFTLTLLGTNALYAGQFDEAWDWHARALSIDRTSLFANLLSPAAPLYAGQMEKAAQAIRSASQIFPKDSLLWSYEALLCAKRGECRKAERLIHKATHGGASLLHTHHMMHTVAAAYGVLGKPQLAVSWLRKASSHGLPLYPVFRDDPHFESMRTHPQFLRFLATLKKQWTSYHREFGGLAKSD
jgi:TolB-like protein/Tfp pilus assembly protein PilF